MSLSESAILETSLFQSKLDRDKSFTPKTKKITNTCERVRELANKAATNIRESETAKIITSSLSKDSTNLNKQCGNTSDSGISDTIKHSKSKSKKRFSKKINRLEQETREEINFYQRSDKMCCTRKCFCCFLIALFVIVDILLNIFFVTDSFQIMPSFNGYNISSSLLDIWIISIARDLILALILICVVIRHKFISGFVKFVHKKYISAFLCLIMYSFAMIKMLLHSDTRQVKQSSMFMFLWNVIAGFLFFINWYMLRYIFCFILK